ncbi:MAG: 4-(cytidine 5'-diphospho)-2-C-methyl-D-erythritol kinase [Sulfobacillus sp.]
MLSIPAYAKLNLSLDVLGLRPDGYHDIRSVVQTVSLADLITLRPERSLVVESPISPPEHDLVWRAARLLQRSTGAERGVRIQVRKEIPVGAGLGGGSADAAATLVGLNELWELRLTQIDLMEIGAELGSDVPFLVRGGTALVEGRGDRVTPLPALAPVFFVILWPNFSLGTDQVYRLVASGSGARSSELLDRLSAGHWHPTGNDLTDAACQVAPDLGTWIADVTRRMGRAPQLTGSGSAVFCLADSQQHAEELAARAPGGGFVRVVQTVEEKASNRANARADRGRDPGGH